jgi:hypothetical protein
MLAMLESFVLLHTVATGTCSGKFSCMLNRAFELFKELFLIEELYSIVNNIFSLTVRSSSFTLKRTL